MPDKPPKIEIADLLALIPQGKDGKLMEATLACMHLLAGAGGSDLNRAFERCSRAAAATLWEFHKEVSPGLLNALVINLCAGARATGKTEQARLLFEVFRLMQTDAGVFDTALLIATYAETLAPYAKREAEIIVQARRGSPENDNEHS